MRSQSRPSLRRASTSSDSKRSGWNRTRWACFDYRQNHIRACNAIVRTRSAQITARIHLSQYRNARRCRLSQSNSEIPTTGTSGSSPHLKTTPDLSGRGVSHFLRKYPGCASGSQQQNRSSGSVHTGTFHLHSSWCPCVSHEGLSLVANRVGLSSN